uniref:Uncharacterized protein n=1 Tax=Rhipicephalus zambeziensis TaxID=60191 RepID=A0A224Y758_9ACAR
MQPTPPKKRRKIVRQLPSPRKKTVKSTSPKEGHKENAADDFHGEDFRRSLVSTNILSNHPSTTMQLSPDRSDATHQAVVSVERAVQVDSRMPRPLCDVRAINRTRVQIFRNNKIIKKLQEENELLRQKLEIFETISQCIEQGEGISRGLTIGHFVLKTA